MHISDLQERMRVCGIAGAGGAGFPAYAKLNEKADVIILNCAECEPLFKPHRQLLEKYTGEILGTLELIAKNIDASFIVAVKKAYKQTVDAVESLIGEYPHGKVCLLEEIYPIGDEVVLIYETTGRRVKSGGLPIECGVIVYNVETMLDIYHAFKAKKPVTHKYVTVAGEVKEPKTLRVPIGTEISHLIKLCGGVTCDSPGFINGGPMTGKPAKLTDTVTKTTNGILVLPENLTVISKRRERTSNSVKRAMSTCCHCRMCTDLCPRNQLGHPIEPHAFMNAIANGVNRAADIKALINSQYCSQCGVCEMYACMQGLSPRSLIGEFRDGLRKNGLKLELREPAEINPMREYRRLPVKRLTERLGLTKYDVPAPIDENVQMPEYIRINLRQNIGVPAKPVVSENDDVKAETIIAEATDGLSIPLHCPADGTVEEITSNFIKIRVKERK